MHTYSIDNNLRRKVYAYLALFSYLLTLIIITLVNNIMGIFVDEPISSFIISIPFWGLVFAIVTSGFNRWGWKTDIIRQLGVVEVPDFSGHWQGWVTETRSDLPSRYDKEKMPARMEIEQAWNRLVIKFETKNSKSTSIGATILLNKSVASNIIYHYRNEPKPSKSERLDMHYGTSNLTYSQKDGKEILSGYHYSGPQRETNGQSRFEKVEDFDSMDENFDTSADMGVNWPKQNI